MNKCLWKLLLLTIQLHFSNPFAVKVLNITKCDNSDDNDLGDIEWDISPEDFDQEFTGSFTLPFDIGTNDCEAVVHFKSFAFDEDENKWKFLFKGERSVCNSILKSIPYESFKEAAGLPDECPLPEGKYHLENFPVTGQYALLSDIKNVGPLVKSIVTLRTCETQVLCRKVHTLSE